MMVSRKAIKKILILTNICSLIFLILSSSFILISTNYYFIESQENSNFSTNTPRLSGSEINITTPEDKTYYSGMNGYYPATYGFESENNTEENVDGWFSFGGSSTSAQIINSIDGHNKIYEISDGSTSDLITIFTSFMDQEFGTIEYWYRSNNTLGFQFFGFYYSSEPKFYYYINSTQFHVNPPNISVRNASPNNWYHIRVDFECTEGGYMGLSNDTWKLTINGISSDELLFNSSSNSINSFVITTDMGSSDYSIYIDSVGLSWDTNYDIGDNKNEGILLSFNNNTNLDWIGYSLDGQTNITIKGNITFPVPLDGIHSIQVFGNDSIGNYYKSDIRYFIIDVIEPISSGASSSEKETSLNERPSLNLIIFLILGAIAIVVPSLYVLSKKKERKRELIRRKEILDDLDLKKKRIIQLDNGFQSNKITINEIRSDNKDKILTILSKNIDLELMDELNAINLTTISKKFLKKLNKLDIDVKSKKDILIEALSLTPRERNIILDRMLKSKFKDFIG